MSKRIKLTRGYEAIVDDEAFEHLNQLKWYAIPKGNTVYARRWTSRKCPPRKSIYMHRMIMDFPDEEVDHKNCNGLDNRRENLRITRNKQNNQANVGKMNKKCSSKYKGVHWCKRDKRWYSSIYVNGKGLHLGLFRDEEEAAKIYNKAAIEHFGEFARLNDV